MKKIYFNTFFYYSTSPLDQFPAAQESLMTCEARERKKEVSERSERALRKTRVMDLANEMAADIGYIHY